MGVEKGIKKDMDGFEQNKQEKDNEVHGRV